MAWPTAQDYREAIQNPQINLGDPGLKQGRVECDKLGLPTVISGGFASVYKVSVGETSWAVRCFDREVRDAAKRYAAIAAALEHLKLPYTVPFQYGDRGILVKGNWYPVVKMEWISGDPLDKYIREHVQDRGTMRSLAERWMQMAHALEAAGIAHGDLQHGNVLVAQGQLKLVDYDGMYVPKLAGAVSNEVGHNNYQHPLRGARDFSPALDHFSVWLIYLSLYALSLDPGLWEVLDGGDECILFRRDDLSNPSSSHAFQWMQTIPDPALHQMVAQVRQFLTLPPLRVPPLAAPLPPQLAPADNSGGRHTFPVGAGTSAARSSNHVANRWYSQHQAGAAASPSPHPSLPQIPPPKQPMQALGARSWLPAVTAPSRVHAFSPVAGWQRQLVVLCLLSLALALASLFILPLASLLFVAIFAAGLAVLAIKYRREAAAIERRTVKGRVDSLNRQLTRANDKIRDLNRTRARLEANHKSVSQQLVKAEVEMQASVRSEQQKLKSDAQKEFTSIQLELNSLKQQEHAEALKLLNQLRSQHLEHFLLQSRIENANISGVGPVMKVRLTLSGVVSAAQVSRRTVSAVPGFGAARTQAVLQWAEGCRARAQHTMPTQISPAQSKLVAGKYALRRSQLESHMKQSQLRLPSDLAAIAQRWTAWLQSRELELVNRAQEYVSQVDGLDKQIASAYLEQYQWQAKVEEAKRELGAFKSLTFFSYVGHTCRGPRRVGTTNPQQPVP